MSDEEIAEKKLRKLTGATDLPSAIEELEKKKQAMEDEFKEEAHYLSENLNPVNLLNRTLQNIKESSSSKYSLFKEALEFGAGNLSKKSLIHQFKNALINTFGIQEEVAVLKKIAVNDKQEEKETDESKQTEEKQTDKKSNKMNLQTQSEKVKAKPEVLPEPTYWPFFLAMGLAFLGWGLLTTWLISLAGFIILIVALTGWINILRHE